MRITISEELDSSATDNLIKCKKLSNNYDTMSIVRKSIVVYMRILEFISGGGKIVVIERTGSQKEFKL